MGERFYNYYGPGKGAIWKIFHLLSIYSGGQYGAFRGEKLPKTYSIHLSAKTFDKLEDKIQRTKTR